MSTRTKVLLVAAILFALANVAFTVMHARMHEVAWAGAHAGLVVLSALVIRRLTPRGAPREQVGTY